MSEDIFKPTLSNDSHLESYDINKFFYIAFFCGVIPVIVLGTINAKWLKVKSSTRILLIAFGIIVLFSKVIVASLMSIDYLNFENRYLRWGYRIATVLLYIAYYYVMKKKHEQFIMFGGKNNPLLKPAIIWTIVGIVIEGALLLTGAWVAKNVL